MQAAPFSTSSCCSLAAGSLRGFGSREKRVVAPDTCRPNSPGGETARASGLGLVVMQDLGVESGFIDALLNLADS
ncbi:hypothetical protein [Hyphomicrobium facile]|uniref:Uncharacterized protein n=1 Tax=Hyphomicrobium facile TaxID=51670 RepID=A0A1I7NHP5_9HYPH|nr:hypothetical protein [Hyphomicrobium facile]SFV34153.1 hypothetical protein SAMN04488557_2236 [Hyphomicrobium facile]